MKKKFGFKKNKKAKLLKKFDADDDQSQEVESE